MICDLTGLDVANASLLDEATAAAEAMALAERASAVEDRNRSSSTRRASADAGAAAHPRRAAGLEAGHRRSPAPISTRPTCSARCCSIPAVPARCAICGPRSRRCAPRAALAVVAADLLALTLLASPGELGADIAIGSAQRFGVPMGYGGPHAAYMAVRDALKRSLPGRIVGLSVDSRGAAGLSAGAADPRAAYPPRKGDLQHLHRAGAAGGDRLDVRGLSRPRGPDAIARHGAPARRRAGGGLGKLGFAPASQVFFDTVTVACRREAGRDRRPRARRKDQSAHRQRHARHPRRRDHDAGDRRGGVARLRRQARLCATSRSACARRFPPN